MHAIVTSHPKFQRLRTGNISGNSDGHDQKITKEMRIYEESVDKTQDEILEIEPTLCQIVFQYIVLQLAILVVVLKVAYLSLPYYWVPRTTVLVSLAILLVNAHLGISTIYAWANKYKNLLNQLDRVKHKHGADGRVRLTQNQKRRSIIMGIFMGLIFMYASLIFGYVVIVAMSI